MSLSVLPRCSNCRPRWRRCRQTRATDDISPQSTCNQQSAYIPPLSTQFCTTTYRVLVQPLIPPTAMTGGIQAIVSTQQLYGRQHQQLAGSVYHYHWHTDRQSPDINHVPWTQDSDYLQWKWVQRWKTSTTVGRRDTWTGGQSIGEQQ